MVLLFAIFWVVISMFRTSDRPLGNAPHYIPCAPLPFTANRMSESDTLAWVFLSVPKPPVTLDKIIAMADLINKTVPSHQELQVSLCWLKDRGFVHRDGSCYSQTESGSRLLSRLTDSKRPLWELLRKVSAEFGTMIGSSAPIDDITQEEFSSACQTYHTESQKLLGKFLEDHKEQINEIKKRNQNRKHAA